ncbi:MAG: restriction endonuclease [Actinomycetia bacterium]|nr:restriction endonuclease [Actinomycetes bacterium]
MLEQTADSAELAIRELRQALVVRPDLINFVDPTRFEHVIASIFRDVGYTVEVTRRTQDGGKDLVILQDGHTHAIVEVKRHRQRVGVELVRQLLGVQLRDGERRAILVASNGFTSGAIREAGSKGPRSLGFELELISALDILRAAELLEEPAMSISAIERSRQDYRHWRAQIEEDDGGPVCATLPELRPTLVTGPAE